MNVVQAIEKTVKEKGMFTTDFAAETKKEHENVLIDIRNYVLRNPEHKQEFIVCWYEDGRGKIRKRYYLTAKAKELMFTKYRHNIRVSTFEFKFEQVLRDMFPNEKIITQMSILTYRIDFFLPFVNTIVEYDENHNKYQQEDDQMRMSEIRAEIMRCIVSGQPIYDGDENYEPNPWLEGKDILNVIRVKQGEEIDGLRRILYAIENSGTSILDYIS